ncbi:MAG: hypothetical protein CL730_03775 [Chloroflexi bacterium]|jgi:hypothetical protein|nr:hypothetical protein [Chloroflexota bacterium]|tara:strand:- start:365 stop:745 length:381 start_codon:yes stop_codon:yes gene_type:complete
MQILINTNNIEIVCKLRTNDTATQIKSILPITSKVNVWGDEIYFPISKLNIREESDATDIMNLGEIAFWIQGNSIAIGFGPTPVSISDEIRLINKANIWADALNPDILLNLKKVTQGSEIKITLTD